MVACAAMFAFAACETDNTGEGTNNGGNNNGGTGSKTELATPVLKIEDVTSTSFTVTWEAVENAASYMVTVGNGQPQTVTETSFKLEKLNAGTYKGTVIAMPADSKKYKNSKPATFEQAVTGLTPEEATWVQCQAWLPTEEEAELGFYPFFNVFVSYKGTGITEIRAQAFDFETYGTASIDTLIADCESIEGDKVKVADANTENGLTIVYPLYPATKYRVVSVITNEEGLTVVFDQEIETAEYTPTETMTKWVGNWTLSAEQAVNLTVNDANKIVQALSDEAVTASIEIVDVAPYYGIINVVGVLGLTSQTWDDGTPIETLGLIDEETGNLEVLGGAGVGALQDLGEGWVLLWLSWCLNGENIAISMTDAWTLSLSEDGQTITTVSRDSGKFEDESEYEFLAMDIAALDTNTYGVSFFYEFDTYEKVVLPAGDITLTKAAAPEETPSTQSASMKQLSAKKTFSSSMVVKM